MNALSSWRHLVCMEVSLQSDHPIPFSSPLKYMFLARSFGRTIICFQSFVCSYCYKENSLSFFVIASTHCQAQSLLLFSQESVTHILPPELEGSAVWMRILPGSMSLEKIPLRLQTAQRCYIKPYQESGAWSGSLTCKPSLLKYWKAWSGTLPLEPSPQGIQRAHKLSIKSSEAMEGLGKYPSTWPEPFRASGSSKEL